jgi:hypothetical protein
VKWEREGRGEVESVHERVEGREVGGGGGSGRRKREGRLIFQ